MFCVYPKINRGKVDKNNYELRLSKKLILNCYNSVQSLGATPVSNPNFYYIVYNIYIVLSFLFLFFLERPKEPS